MTETDSAPAPVTERLTVEDVGKRRIRELARRGRKQDTTLANYEGHPPSLRAALRAFADRRNRRRRHRGLHRRALGQLGQVPSLKANGEMRLRRAA